MTQLLRAGAEALPSLLKVAGVSAASGGADSWLDMTELPVAIDLGRDMVFHSVFACPVSRAVDDAPLLMACGHVLGSKTARELSSDGKSRFQCPYCASRELKMSESMRVFL